MKKWLLSALLAFGVLSVTAGAVSAAELEKPVSPVASGEDQIIKPLNFGWGA